MIHSAEPKCQGCKDKLVGVHLALNTWFWDMKEKHPELHVCWGWRGEEDQHADFLSGRSKLDWPKSKHNKMLNGNPCSEALDVFTIDQYGIAHFDRKFYAALAEETTAAGYKITWGGNFPTFKDLDHFQLEDT
jgi:hypothetical protein